jgi:hypothetical protein
LIILLILLFLVVLLEHFVLRGLHSLLYVDLVLIIQKIMRLFVLIALLVISVSILEFQIYSNQKYIMDSIPASAVTILAELEKCLGLQDMNLTTESRKLR